MIEKIFDKLYTLDSRKKIRVFECEVHYNDVTEFFTVITRTGLLDGKKTEKKEIISNRKNIGKSNETTLGAQALLQADSLWRCKWSEGYKSVEFLRNKIQENNIVTVDLDDKRWVTVTIEQANRLYPEWWQTNENWDYLPMLAIKKKDAKKIEFPIYGQQKLNGVRCLARIKRDEFGRVEIKLCSRGGTYYKVPHIEQCLHEMMGYIAIYPFTDMLFDGELYKHGAQLQDISGAARTEDSTALFAINNWLEYHIYDVVRLDLAPAIQRERITDLSAIKIIIEQCPVKWPKIQFIKSRVILDETEIKENHDEFVEKGYEGLILRRPDSYYEFNQRSKGLIKVKEFIDEEFQIIGYKVDQNKSIGESFVFELKNNIEIKGGNGGVYSFYARPTGTIEQKEKWFQDIENLKGSYATVRFQERAKDGLPIQGHVRSDLTEVLHLRPLDE
jgi:hypothetical protein